MQDDLDKLIDRTLAGYSNAEPLAGLEDRILERVRIDRAARKRRRLWWMLALAVPEVAVILFAVWMQKPAPKIQPVAHVAPPPIVQPAPPVVTAKAVRQPRTAPRPPRVELPKQAVFPTPSPLTPEERMLVALAQSHPQALVMNPVEQIEIEPIEIAPLPLDGGQTKEQ